MLEMKGITKEFPGVKALDAVNLTANSGQVLGLIGVNGAGKSTLMNVLGGVLRPDAGIIAIDGREVRFSSPKEAEGGGISFIHQEPLFFSSMTVAQNIFLSRLFPSKIPVFTNNRRAHEETARLLAQLGAEIRPQAKMEDISIGERQIVEIARALAAGSSIVIFDEPTSSLSLHEKENLFSVIGRLREEGKTILYISHFLDEIKEICDRYLVLRDGRVSGEGEVSEVTQNDLAEMVIGKKLEAHSREGRACAGTQVLLKVEQVRSGRLLRDVSFSLHRGEILGLWGLMGSGRTELIRAIFGLDRADGGQVYLDRGNGLSPIKKRHLPRYCGYVTESRHADGLFLPREVWANISATNMEKYQSKLFRVLDTARERTDAEAYVELLSIRTPGVNTRVQQLSGGNQQKVIFAKWLNKDLPILILDEPTRGVDVGAKLEIYTLIRKLADEGRAILVITSEIDEMVDLAHRAIVLREGRIVAEAVGEELSRSNLMHLALEGVDSHVH